MRTRITLMLLMVLTAGKLWAQEFKAGLDFRDRFEYRHGFGSLIPDDTDPAAFVRQRARINLSYKSELLETKFSFQDISTWGDTRQILPADDNASLMIFEAWAALRMGANWKLKLGRQVISYDDQRILGGLDWAMQGRFHDAALLMYKNNSFKADLGFAFSQQGEPRFGNGYGVLGFFSYKSMQFLHMTKTWENASASFLFLNNGFQIQEDLGNGLVPAGTYNRQTTGIFYKLPVAGIQLEGFGYWQTGEAANNVDLSAYDIGLQASVKANTTLFGLGFEMLSGTDQAGESKNKSFFPLYGTNHKFNGFMDYFYVGNHANNVGLNDVFAKVNFAFSENGGLLVKGHYFASNADLIGDADKYLGTEIDVVYTRKLFKFAKLNLGYSHMFASDSMSLIKGGVTNDNTNNWAWAMIVVNPELFTFNFQK